MLAAKYILMIWMTLPTGPTFAEHDFTSKEMCESFKFWFVKDQKSHDARAICVVKREYEI